MSMSDIQVPTIGKPPPDLPDGPETSYMGPGGAWLAADVQPDPEAESLGTDATMARPAVSDSPISASESWGTLTFGTAPAHDAFGPVPGSASGYRSISSIGEGGVGEVWKAEQVSLGRTVAIKRIREDLTREGEQSTPASILLHRYFLREAKTAAHLDHPNILPVYDLGLDESMKPVIAMKLVTGTPWSRLLRSDFTEMAGEDYLQKHFSIFMAVVQAVAFAHSRGIVHRDLKPSQVMVGEFGEVQLIDWGLAASVDPATLPEMWRPSNPQLPPNVSTANNPAGTAAYMAPEQTESTAAKIGPWTDTFLLGGTLYTILTGSVLYIGKTSREAFRQAQVGQWRPIDVAAEGRAVPPELAALTEELLVPDWRDRKLTAAALLSRLREYLTGTARRREAIELVALVREEMASKLEGYGDFERLLARLERSLNLWQGSAEVAPLREELHRRYVGLALRNNDLVLARLQCMGVYDAGERERLLAAIAAREAALERREGQRRSAIRGVLALTGCSLLFAAYAWRQKGKADTARDLAEASQNLAQREQYFAAVGYADASINSINLRKAREVIQSAPEPLREWEWYYLKKRMRLFADSIDAPAQLLCCEWSPDGKHLAFGGEFKSLSIFDLESRATTPLVGHEDKIYNVAYSPDGTRLLSTSKDKTARLWDVATGECLRVLEGHKGWVYAAEFHPTKPLVLTSSGDFTARIWDLESDKFTELAGHTKIVFSAVFTSDGKQVVTGSRDRSVKFWDVETGELLRTLQTTHRSGVTSAVLSPAGNLLMTTSWDGDAKIYLADTFEETATLRLHTDAVYRGLFAKDGEHVYTFSHDGTFALWNVASARPMARYSGHEGLIWDGAFDPERKRLATAGYDSKVLVWDIPMIDPTPQVLDENPMPVKWKSAERASVYSSADSSYASLDDQWESPEGARLVSASGVKAVIASGRNAISDNGRYRVVFDQPGDVFDREKKNVAAKLSPDAVKTAAFSPDGSSLVLAFDNAAAIYETRNWKQRQSIPEGPPVRHVKFSGDGSLFAVARWIDRTSNTVEVYRSATMERVFGETGDWGESDIFAFSSDNRTMAFATLKEWLIRSVDLEKGTMALDFTGHTNRVVGLAFLPDSSRLFSVAIDSTFRAWDAENARELLLRSEASGDQYIGIAVASDGRTLLLPSNMGRLYVFGADGYDP